MIKKELSEQLMNEGFHKAGVVDAYTDVFWKSQDGVKKGIVFANAIMLQICSKYGVERIRTACYAEYPYLDEILVILVGNIQKMHIRAKNLVCIDCASFRTYSWKISPMFSTDVSSMLSYLKYKRFEKMRKEHSYESRKEYVPWSMWVLMLLTTGISLFMMYADKSKWVISANAIYNKNQTYRLFSYMFLHGSYAHLVGNMLSLVFVGNMLTKRIGNMRSFLIYIGGGILAGLVAVDYRMVMINDVVTQTVGASGAIFALLGALLCDIYMDETMRHERLSWLKYAVLTLVFSSIGWNIDIACHIGGFLGGITLMYCLNLISRISNDRVYIRLSRKVARYERG